MRHRGDNEVSQHARWVGGGGGRGKSNTSKSQVTTNAKKMPNGVAARGEGTCMIHNVKYRPRAARKREARRRRRRRHHPQLVMVNTAFREAVTMVRASRESVR
jgi:hypothetical protein